MDQFHVLICYQFIPSRFETTLLVLFSCLLAHAKANNMWGAWLPVISFRSWQHILSLSGCLRAQISISQIQINLFPVSHQHCTFIINSQPVAISLLTEPDITFSLSPEQQCLALFFHTTCWVQWLQYRLHHTPNPFSLTALCPALCSLITNFSACPWSSPRTLWARRPNWWNYLCC